MWKLFLCPDQTLTQIFEGGKLEMKDFVSRVCSPNLIEGIPH